jgi:hypothetical protein
VPHDKCRIALFPRLHELVWHYPVVPKAIISGWARGLRDSFIPINLPMPLGTDLQFRHLTGTFNQTGADEA